MKLPQLARLLHAIRSRLADSTVQLALPETCGGCGMAGSWMCEGCLENIQREEPGGCDRCGRRGPRRARCSRCGSLFPRRFRMLRAGFAYDGPMRRSIQRFKYNGEHERGRFLAALLLSRRPDILQSNTIDALVPVPLHPRRLRQRGFNQSLVIAEVVSENLGIPVVEALRRQRHTIPQVQLRSSERLENLRDAFTFNLEHEAVVRNKRVLLIDDVTTTGATMAASAEVLEQAGARQVSGLTIAREQ